MLRTFIRYFVAVPLLAITFIGLTIFLEIFFKASPNNKEFANETALEANNIFKYSEEVADQIDNKQGVWLKENAKVLSPPKNLVAKESIKLSAPLDRIAERIIKKKFGTFVSPQKSPVSPERFFGYHNAIDLEIFPRELNETVVVRAVCDGKLLLKKIVAGYGGVVVQSCTLGDAPITIVYGHLKLDSVEAKVDTHLKAGNSLGILGKGMSAETGGERKHLHLGFHKGSLINIKGYVQKETALLNWIDPCLYLCEN